MWSWRRLASAWSLGKALEYNLYADWPRLEVRRLAFCTPLSVTHWLLAALGRYDEGEIRGTFLGQVAPVPTSW